MRQIIANLAWRALHPQFKVQDPRVLDRALRRDDVIRALCDLICYHEPVTRLVILSGTFGGMVAKELTIRGYTTLILPGGLKDTPVVLPDIVYGECIFADDTCFTEKTTRNVEQAVLQKGGKVISRYYAFRPFNEQSHSLCDHEDVMLMDRRSPP